MASRTRNNTALETDRTSENDTLNTSSYRSEITLPRRSSKKETPVNDELISMLSDAYENKRARQVTEWERHQNVQLSL